MEHVVAGVVQEVTYHRQRHDGSSKLIHEVVNRSALVQVFEWLSR